MTKNIIAFRALQAAIKNDLETSEKLRGKLARATLVQHDNTYARERFERESMDHGRNSY